MTDESDIVESPYSTSWLYVAIYRMTASAVTRLVSATLAPGECDTEPGRTGIDKPLTRVSSLVLQSAPTGEGTAENACTVAAKELRYTG